jgi:hypothetical protein
LEHNCAILEIECGMSRVIAVVWPIGIEIEIEGLERKRIYFHGWVGWCWRRGEDVSDGGTPNGGVEGGLTPRDPFGDS